MVAVPPAMRCESVGLVQVAETLTMRQNLDVKRAAVGFRLPAVALVGC